MNDHQSTAEHFNIAGELGSSMCANCIHIPALDQQWQTRLAVDGEHAGKVDHKMEFAGFRINRQVECYVYSDHKHSSPCHGCA